MRQKCNTSLKQIVNALKSDEYMWSKNYRLQRAMEKRYVGNRKLPQQLLRRLQQQQQPLTLVEKAMEKALSGEMADQSWACTLTC